VRLKKRTPSEVLLEVLRGRLGPALAEYAPVSVESNSARESAA
jgi:hypothetical protein